MKKFSFPRFLILSLLTILISFPAQSKKLSDHSTSFKTQPKKLSDYEIYEYDLRFTNPQCLEYKYPKNAMVLTNAGNRIFAKPKNVYCSHLDSSFNSKREGSPTQKFEQWINDPNTKEVFMAFFSWSNTYLTKAICEAIKTRGLALTAIISSNSELEMMNSLNDCWEEGSKTLGNIPKPKLLTRGHEGYIGHAHNKIFIVNPTTQSFSEIKDPVERNKLKRTTKLAYGSGNFTSGLTLHHENWHFVTIDRNSYFAQLHIRCLREGMLEHGRSRREYTDFVKNCRSALGKAGLTPEEDVQVYLIPAGDQGKEITKKVADKIKDPRTNDILLAAHRFALMKFISPIERRLRGSNPPSVKLIFDDDAYWVMDSVPNFEGEVDEGCYNQDLWNITPANGGDNTGMEGCRVELLRRAGAEVRYMETNHHEGAHFLHHNKFIIFNTSAHTYNPKTKEGHFAADDDLRKAGAAVLTGAANFTRAAYGDVRSVEEFEESGPGDAESLPNYENIYFITNPEIVRKFKEQYQLMTSQLATLGRDMPTVDVAPGEEM